MSTQNVGSLVSASGILLFIDGTQYSVANDHPKFNQIKDALTKKDYKTVVNLMDLRTGVRTFLSTDKNFKLTNDQITLNDEPFSHAITDKVLRMIDAGNDAEPLFNFLRKVRKNPSATSQAELLLFCEANGFMIHTDGDILAYKSVRHDYKDVHSGTNDNRVGAVVKMPRHQVDDRRDVTCSSGLHFASHDYATKSFASDRLMVLKVNPEHVVSIPNDYNNQKGRCCEYTVVGELTPSDRTIPDPNHGRPAPWSPPSTQLPNKEVLTNEDLGIEDEGCSCTSCSDCAEDCKNGCDCDNSTEDETAEIENEIYSLRTSLLSVKNKLRTAIKNHKPRKELLEKKKSLEDEIAFLEETIELASRT